MDKKQYIMMRPSRQRHEVICHKLKSTAATKLTEAAFRHQSLTSESVEIIVSNLTAIKALDLSYNKIEAFPQGMPVTLIALDLSFNSFTDFVIPKNGVNLIELKLMGNKIASTKGLSTATALKHLDLSENRISRIEGLEALMELESLNLNNNKIVSPMSLRPLSFNKSLKRLSLMRNPVGGTSVYKIILMNFIPSLICLDGSPITQRQKLHDQNRSGYTAIFTEILASLPVELSQTELNYKRLSDGLSVIDNEVYDDNGNTNETESCDDVISSSLPWRKPPFPLPRPWKGCELFSSTTKSLQRSTSAGRMTRTGDEFDIADSDVKIGGSCSRRISPTDQSHFVQQESHKWQSPELARKRRSRSRPESTIIDRLGLPSGADSFAKSQNENDKRFNEMVSLSSDAGSTSKSEKGFRYSGSGGSWGSRFPGKKGVHSSASIADPHAAPYRDPVLAGTGSSTGAGVDSSPNRPRRLLGDRGYDEETTSIDDFVGNQAYRAPLPPSANAFSDEDYRNRQTQHLAQQSHVQRHQHQHHPMQYQELQQEQQRRLWQQQQQQLQHQPYYLSQQRLPQEQEQQQRHYASMDDRSELSTSVSTRADLDETAAGHNAQLQALTRQRLRERLEARYWALDDTAAAAAAAAAANGMPAGASRAISGDGNSSGGTGSSSSVSVISPSSAPSAISLPSTSVSSSTNGSRPGNSFTSAGVGYEHVNISGPAQLSGAKAGPDTFQGDQQGGQGLQRLLADASPAMQAAYAAMRRGAIGAPVEVVVAAAAAAEVGPPVSSVDATAKTAAEGSAAAVALPAGYASSAPYAPYAPSTNDTETRQFLVDSISDKMEMMSLGGRSIASFGATTTASVSSAGGTSLRGGDGLGSVPSATAAVSAKASSASGSSGAVLLSESQRLSAALEQLMVRKQDTLRVLQNARKVSL